MIAATVMVAPLVFAAGPVNARGHDNGIRGGPEIAVTATDLVNEPANNSPVVVADPTNARFVVLANRLDAPDFGCALQISGDGGRGWAPANPVPVVPPGAEKCYAPEVAFDRQGILYYLFVGLAGTGNEPVGAFLTTSSDRARTFSPPRQVLGPANFAVRMAIDPTMGVHGRIQMVWLHATSPPTVGGFGPPPNPILGAHSDDGGKTFSEPVAVSEPTRGRVVAPALVLGPDHVVYVAYYDLGRDAVDYQGLEGPTWDGTWSVVLSRSGDAGAHFDDVGPVDAGVVPNERVMLIYTMPPPSAVVLSRSRLCVAWTDARYGDADAVLRCSGDAGRSWEPVRRLNTDREGNGHSQYLPRLGSSGDRLDAVFYDRAGDPQNRLTSVDYTFSPDGGRQFSAVQSVNREAFDPTIGPRYSGVAATGKVEFGSRLGLLSRPGLALIAWADTRNSQPTNTDQDIFATFLLVDRRGGGTAPTVLAGLVGLAVGVVAGVEITRRRNRRLVVAA